MSRTEDLVKPFIQRLLDERADVLRPAAERGARDYPLRMEGRAHPFLADFACRLPDDGWLFVEDDDAKRALSNVANYWKWVEENAVGADVYLVHLIGPGARELAEFAGRKAREAYPGFRHEIIRVERWDDPAWHDALAHALDAVTGAHGGDGALDAEPRGAEPLGPLRDDPAIGMWRDREDMKDSTAWVRALREKEWDRSRR